MEGVIVAAIGAVLLRLMVGLHGYSGQGVAPRFGDYEAQRPWMEITVSSSRVESSLFGPIEMRCEAKLRAGLQDDVYEFADRFGGQSGLHIA